MAEQNQLGFFALIRNFLDLFFKLISDVSRLVHLEAQLASRSLLKIFVLAFILAILLTSTWLCFLGLLLYFLLSLQLGWLVSLSLIILFNFFIIFLVCIFIFKAKNNLFFPATRRQLA